MTIPVVPKPAFPTIPDAPGVPPIPRNPATPPPDTQFENADGSELPVDAVNQIWGVFDSNNQPAFVVDTYVSIKPKNDSKVSDFPVESGSFVTFNKVQTPYDVKVTVALGGDAEAMSTLLERVNDMQTSFELFSITTPYESYLNATLVTYDYSHEAKTGSNMIKAELFFKEIRQVSAQFTTVKLPAAKVKNAASASAVDGGKKQGKKTSAITSLRQRVLG